jgi:hypothetical protein
MLRLKKLFETRKQPFGPPGFGSGQAAAALVVIEGLIVPTLGDGIDPWGDLVCGRNEASGAGQQWQSPAPTW